MSLSGVILGLINIAIVVVIFLFVGAVILWGLSFIGVSVPAMVQQLYIAIIVLVALYMVVALIFGLPSISVIPFR